jgi:coenzyme F420-0:L-glutamate ligase/coenzyme F420-1:gamma-L-glutamate ligase
VAALHARTLPGIPEVRPGDDLAALILEAAGPGGLEGDELVAVAHTVVSKQEGALVRLDDVRPGERARELAAAHAKDPRLVQVVLDEAEEVLRAERGVLIARTRHGLVCANAGVDVSNAGAPDTAVLLPRDPDASARRLRARIRELGRGERAAAPAEAAGPAVLISDTFGRPWRLGQTDVAIGLAGMAPVDDWRGRRDSEGRDLQATLLAVSDAAAAASDLVREKDSGEPVVVLSGLGRFITPADGPGARALLRPLEEDLFR